jgi:hypothetical protein
MDLKEVAELIILQVNHNKDCGKEDCFTVEEIVDLIQKRVQDNVVLPDVMRWFYCEENRLPSCWEQGNWDGKKSELIIGETITGKRFIGCCYEGYMDGSSFFDWYENSELLETDYLITETVVRWMNIPT